jgi:hypothetical protein
MTHSTTRRTVESTRKKAAEKMATGTSIYWSSFFGGGGLSGFGVVFRGSLSSSFGWRRGLPSSQKVLSGHCEQWPVSPQT